MTFNQILVCIVTGVITCLLTLVVLNLANCDDRIPIYDSQYGGKVVGAISEDGVIYDEQYGGKAVGRIGEDGTIKDKRYGGDTIGRIGKDEEEYEEWKEEREWEE